MAAPLPPPTPPAADVCESLDRRTYQCCEARAGVQGILKAMRFFFPLRLAQLAAHGCSAWHLLLMFGLGAVCRLVTHAVLRSGPAARPCGADSASVEKVQPSATRNKSCLDDALQVYVLVQLLLWALSLAMLAVIFLTPSDDFHQHLILWGLFVPCLFMQCAVHYLPRSVYFAVVLPVNLCVFLTYYSSKQQLTMASSIHVVGIVAICAYVYHFKDRMNSDLFSAKMDAERAWHNAKLEREKVNSWQTAFEGVMNGIFDARCVCEVGGLIRNSTPQLDQLLLGGGAASDAGDSRLHGWHLPSFAIDANERQRMESFLVGLSSHGVMQKMQLSLAPASLPGRSRSCAEVSICGILLPHVAAAANPSCSGVASAQVLLCFQVVGGEEPAEITGTAVEDAVCALPPVWEMASSAEHVQLRSRLGSDDIACSVGEGLRARPAEHAPLRSRLGSDDIASSVGEGLRARPAPSYVSAPPALVQPKGLSSVPADEACESGGDGSDGDCLPPDAVVWVEGQSLPSKVLEIEAGQRVLCYDHLAGGLKYSEVTDVATHDASASEWVVVTLEDGTELKMTSDHPVYAQLGGTPGESSRLPVRAGELRAAAHSLEVLRLVPVPVREVRIMAGAGAAGAGAGSTLEEGAVGSGAGASAREAAPRERVSLSVRQPERHSVFVASGPGGGGSMAVASANLDVQVAGQRFRVKNTFLQGQEEEEQASLRHRRRAGSAPPTVRGGGDDQPRLRRRSPSAHSAHTAASSHASSVASSWRTSVAGVAPRVVIGANQAYDRNTVELQEDIEKKEVQSVLKLSQVLTARRHGLKSIGGLGHAEGWCCPCLMETWHRFGKDKKEPCKWGMMCDHCHEDHDPQDLNTLRRQRSKIARSKRAASKMLGKMPSA